MIKRFATLFANMGMRVSGDYAVGEVNGYDTSAFVSLLDAVSPLKIHIAFFGTQHQREQIDQEIKRGYFKIKSFQLTSFGLKLCLDDITVGRLVKKTRDILLSVYKILDNAQVKGCRYCPACSNELDSQPARKKVGTSVVLVHRDCTVAVEQALKNEAEEEKNAPNNYLKGFLGALLGASICVIVLIALFFLEYISTWMGIVGVMLSAFFYKKFGAKQNAVMIVMTSLTTIFFVMATMFGFYLFVSAAGAYAAGSDMGAFEAFAKFMNDEAFSMSFMRDIALTFMFTLLGVVVEIITFSAQKRF